MVILSGWCPDSIVRWLSPFEMNGGPDAIGPIFDRRSE
jgi:hypothetical protein